MKKGKMIILKTVCDVPDPEGKKLFGHLICGEPAIGVGSILVTVMYGKEGFHVCAKHAGLPLEQLMRLVYKDHEIGPIDDAQR